MSSEIGTLDAAFLNLLGPGGIEFDVPQGPVRLSAEDLDLLSDMSSSIEGLTIF